MHQLNIEAFNNSKGGNSFFKAATHRVAARLARGLIARLARSRALAVYDPLGFATGFAEFYGIAEHARAGIFVQDVDAIGRKVLGRPAQPVTELAAAKPDAVLIAAFDAGRFADHIRHLVPAGAEIVSFDAMRLPDGFLTNRRNYLDPLNFATNFAFFRDADGLHTRLVTANYWPADRYAGLPAPERVEQVTLWVQNGHPCPIPSGAVGLNLMGHDEISRLELEIPPFASHRLDVASLLPTARWPAQIEVRAGKYFVRPRYEIAKTVTGRVGNSGRPAMRIRHV